MRVFFIELFLKRQSNFRLLSQHPLGSRYNRCMLLRLLFFSSSLSRILLLFVVFVFLFVVCPFYSLFRWLSHPNPTSMCDSSNAAAAATNRTKNEENKETTYPMHSSEITNFDYMHCAYICDVFCEKQAFFVDFEVAHPSSCRRSMSLCIFIHTQLSRLVLCNVDVIVCVKDYFYCYCYCCWMTGGHEHTHTHILFIIFGRIPGFNIYVLGALSAHQPIGSEYCC